MRSGALITARKALQQGRVLYALPGRADEAGSEGPLRLIRDGARMLVAADDILTDFDKVYADKINIFRLLEKSPFIVDKVLRSMHVYAKADKRPKPTAEELPKVEAKPKSAPDVSIAAAAKPSVWDMLNDGEVSPRK